VNKPVWGCLVNNSSITFKIKVLYFPLESLENPILWKKGGSLTEETGFK
jgi:hypothetical protein